MLVTASFVLLQATNTTSMSFLAVYVPQTVSIDVVRAGIALGVAAGLEVPALMIVARLTTRGVTALGQRATLLACAVLTLVGLLILAAASRRSKLH